VQQTEGEPPLAFLHIQESSSALLPLAVKVVVYGGNLYTETGFPLYRYVPLAYMVRLGKLPIPWASEWGDSIAAWVSNYVPLPRTDSEMTVAAVGLGFQARDGAVLTYEQAVYQGWPLYTCAYDAPGFINEAQCTVPGLFEMVSVEEPWGGTTGRTCPPGRATAAVRKRPRLTSADRSTAVFRAHQA